MFCIICIFCVIVTTAAATTAETTTREPCDCSRFVPVGISDGRIPNKNMTSRDIRINKPGTPEHTGPDQARLNNNASENGTGAWEPLDTEGYIQIDFSKTEHVKQIKTQGSPLEDKYVTRHFIYYNVDGTTKWHRLRTVSKILLKVLCLIKEIF